MPDGRARKAMINTGLKTELVSVDSPFSEGTRLGEPTPKVRECFLQFICIYEMLNNKLDTGILLAIKKTKP